MKMVKNKTLVLSEPQTIATTAKKSNKFKAVLDRHRARNVTKTSKITETVNCVHTGCEAKIQLLNRRLSNVENRLIELEFDGHE